MGILPDYEIDHLARNGMVRPYDSAHVQPASIDVHLGPDLKIETDGPAALGPDIDNSVFFEDGLLPEWGYEVAPGELVLGCTHETISLPDGIAARFEGKSSLGRLGLMTHVTAGFIDPGFTGQITVEITKVGRRPFRLMPGMKIGQICFYTMDGTPTFPYGTQHVGSHYQGQRGPQVSRIHERFNPIDVFEEEKV